MDSDSEFENFGELLDEYVCLLTERQEIDMRLQEKRAPLAKIMRRREFGQTVKELLRSSMQHNSSQGSGESAATASAEGDPIQGSGESAATASAEGDPNVEPASPQFSSDQIPEQPPLPSRWLCDLGAAEAAPDQSASLCHASGTDCVGARAADTAPAPPAPSCPAIAAGRNNGSSAAAVPAGGARVPSPISSSQQFVSSNTLLVETGPAMQDTDVAASTQQGPAAALAISSSACSGIVRQVQCPDNASTRNMRLLPARDRALPVIAPHVTTLIVRKIPQNFTQQELLQEFPMDGTYDFLYFPYGNNIGRSVGVAFINFLTHEHAVRFCERWHGRRLSRGGRTSLTVEASRVQGRNANLRTVRHDAPVLPVVMQGCEYLSAQRVLEMIDKAKAGISTWRV